MSTHYFSSEPSALPEERRLITFSARGHDFQAWVAGNVFSHTRLDPGTEQLLKVVPPLPPESTILDLGCGWGPVALALATEHPTSTVLAVDVNPRAVALTRDNADLLGLTNVKADLVETALPNVEADGVRFDVIMSNPPVHVGKEPMHRMLLTWLPHLASDGVAWLVMSKNLGGDSLITWLRGQGYRAEKRASRKGFRIIEVRHGQNSL